MDFPPAAIFCPAGAPRWELPAEDLLELTGRHAATEIIDGWQIAAFEPSALIGGRVLVPAVRDLAESNGSATWSSAPGSTSSRPHKRCSGSAGCSTGRRWCRAARCSAGTTSKRC